MKHYIRYLLKIDKAHTQTTSAEQEALKKYASGKRTAVEIGVYEGVNTVMLASVLHKEGILYGIDPFFPGRLGFSYQKLIAENNLRRNRVSPKVKLLQMFSADAGSKVPDDLDFIFVDGDHSYEGIRKDWDIYSNKVKPGGIIALHDSAIFFYPDSKVQFGSVEYFDAVISKDPRFRILEKVDSCNFLQRI